MATPVKKHPFSVAEDMELLQFVKAQGTKNWPIIASQLNRSAKQCRERWNGHLDPTINKGPWTTSEDIILARKQNELGNKWAEISKFLPGRTDTIVKNRWNTSVKNRVHELLFKQDENISSTMKTTDKMINNDDLNGTINNIIARENEGQTAVIAEWLNHFNEQKNKFIPSINDMNSLPPLMTAAMKK